MIRTTPNISAMRWRKNHEYTIITVRQHAIKLKGHDGAFFYEFKKFSNLDVDKNMRTLI